MCIIKTWLKIEVSRQKQTKKYFLNNKIWHEEENMISGSWKENPINWGNIKKDQIMVSLGYCVIVRYNRDIVIAVKVYLVKKGWSE